MSARYPGAIISKTPPVPAGPYQSNAASGVWTLDQQLQYQKQGIWPTAGLLPNYIEDYFSTYLYQQNTIGSNIPVATGVGFISTSAWDSNLLSTTAQAQQMGCVFDSAGNYYVAVSDISTGGYVAKFSSNGTKVWLIKLSPSAQYLIFSSIKVAASGNVYVAGVIANANSPFVCKLNSSGAVQWTQYISGGATGSTYSAMELDASENVHYAYSTVTTNRGAYAKFNSSGVQDTTVSKVFYTATQTYIKGITVDATGNIYICGFYYDSGTTYYYGFAAKFNSSMAFQWNSALYTTAGGPKFNGVSVDGSGNVYVTGTQRSGSNDEFLIAKFNSSGALQWQNSLAATGGREGYAIKVDSTGNSYVVGNGNGKWQIAKVTSGGSLSWQSTVTATLGINYPYAYAVDIDSSGNLLVAGNTNETTTSSTHRTNLIKINQDGSSYGVTAAATLALSSVAFGSSSGTSDTRTFTVTTGTTFSSVTFTAASDSLTTSVTNIAASTSSGAMLWIKNRTTTATNHLIFPTATTYLSSNTTAAAAVAASYLTSQSSNGFLIPSDSTTANFVSWSFKKQPKFFDVVTYTGNGTGGRTVAHNLGSVPGCIMVKRTDAISHWTVYHRSVGATAALFLNLTNATDVATGHWQDTAPTSSVFSVGGYSDVNAAGGTYVAYLFAHDAGGFGLTGTDNVITCGSYVGNGNVTTGPVISFGFEPQWVMIKNTSAVSNWTLVDNMRGFTVGSGVGVLRPNTTDTDFANTGYLSIRPTGFTTTTNNADINATGNTYIYIAIRRGPMKVPTLGTSVFSPTYLAGDNTTGRAVSAGFAPDLAIFKRASPGDPAAWTDKLRGTKVQLNSTSTAAEVDQGVQPALASFSNTGLVVNNYGTNINTNAAGTNYPYYSLKRAPGFFDEVCYNRTSGATVTHNLGVTPELLIVKRRGGIEPWGVMRPNTTGYLLLNVTDALNTALSATATSTTFTIGAGAFDYFDNYVAYLFATCAGVSKVFSYTGNGSSQTIACGFTGGARWVMIKRTDSTGDWYVWDTARGIIAGNDPHLSLNTTTADVTTDDSIDPDSTGFIVNQLAATNINVSAATYIGLAIA
jgi:hypothetical protein